MTNYLMEFKLNRFLLHIGAAFSTILGLFVLFGWYTQNIHLIKVLESSLPMQPNAAICFVLFGISLYAYIFSSKWLSIRSAVALTVISSLILAQYIFHVDFGIDELFFKSIFESAHPGRIAANTAVCFFLLSCSLIATNFAYNKYLGSIF